MPMYEYGCEGCGVDTERYEPLVDKQPPPSCGSCGKTMIKFVSMANFDLRGTGFYINEHGSGAHKLAATDQAIRAERDIQKAGLTPATPTGKVGASKESPALEEAYKRTHGSKAKMPF